MNILRIQRNAAIILALGLYSLLLTVQAGPEQGGIPLLSVAVNEAENEDFDTAIDSARLAGMQATTLTIFWDDFEKQPNRFNPAVNWLEVANTYYPAVDVPISLTISVIDTVRTRLPKDLENRPFDDPELIRRFKVFLDYVFIKTPDLRLKSLAIGNEIDGWLDNDASRWKSYEGFYREIAKYIRSKHPHIPVGVKIMYKGMRGAVQGKAQSINRHSDVILVTHYPLDDNFKVEEPGSIAKVFDEMVRLYPGREIHFAELGYPSSRECGSSEDRQAQFVSKVFDAWEENREQVKLITFVWLSDIPESTLAGYKQYYGISGRCFSAFLGTLGLRRSDGSAKPAFRQLISETRKRNW